MRSAREPSRGLFYHVFITVDRFRVDVRMRRARMVSRKHLKTKWRKRVGVEPTGDRVTCRPPVLKITQCVLMRLENLLS